MASLLSASLFLSGTAFGQHHSPRPMPAIAAQYSTVEHSAGEQVLTLPLSDEHHLRALLATRPHPRGLIIMFPGGTGNIGLEQDGHIAHAENFVIRTRALWNRHGYAVLIPDTPEGANLRGLRSTPFYAHLIENLIALAHRQTTGPVFLLGTSQGSIAAVNGAAHARPGTIAGVILTETVSVMGGSGETVFSAEPEMIRVPVLVVANRDDLCNVAPPDAAPRIAAAMTASPNTQVLTVTGGVNLSQKPCSSFSPHGYFGLEDRVVSGISLWLEAHS